MTDNPAVFHLTTRFLTGGAEDEILTTVRGLGDEYQFTVGFGAEFDDEQVGRLRRDGTGTRRFRLIKHYDPITAVPAVLAVARYLSNADFDIVHTHCTEAGIIGRWAAALAGVPNVVHSIHGVPFTEDRNALLNRFVLACERTTAPVTDVLVANADGIAEDYLSRGIGQPRQYTTIYTGVDVDTYADAPAARLPGEGVRILMAARLVEGKGLDVLLDAVAEVDRDDFSVCIAGSGPLEAPLADRIEAQGLSGRVHLLGYRDDMPAVYASSDVFVLPSFREGLPHVISEALAAGLPVVATRIAGIPEQVEDGVNGYLVEPGDASRLAERLSELIDDAELRERMAEASRGRAATFSDERMLTDLDALYSFFLED